MTATLFTPLSLGSLTLANRIVIAPMCQYSAVDGAMTDWHLIHLGQLALSGAAVLTIEATAVTPEGRISAYDVGLYDDATEAAMARVLAGGQAVEYDADCGPAQPCGAQGVGGAAVAGGVQIASGEAGGWQTVAPSALGFRPDDHPPLALDRTGLERIKDAFVASTRRAARLGVDAVQLHVAHGYLLHQFLSPLSNRRDDDYGGSLENRLRFPLEVFEAVRAAFPADRPVTVRVSGTDWAEGGWDIEQTVAFAQALEALGCSAIHVSSGGLTPLQKIKAGPGYQVPLARAVKAAVAMPVVAVGLITDFDQAEAILAAGDADLIALARSLLWNPRWPWHAAVHFGETSAVPDQYLRSAPARG